MVAHRTPCSELGEFSTKGCIFFFQALLVPLPWKLNGTAESRIGSAGIHCGDGFWRHFRIRLIVPVSNGSIRVPHPTNQALASVACYLELQATVFFQRDNESHLRTPQNQGWQVRGRSSETCLFWILLEAGYRSRNIQKAPGQISKPSRWKHSKTFPGPLEVLSGAMVHITTSTDLVPLIFRISRGSRLN